MLPSIESPLLVLLSQPSQLPLSPPPKMDARTARIIIVATTTLAIVGWGVRYALRAPEGEGKDGKRKRAGGEKRRRKKKAVPTPTPAPAPSVPTPAPVAAPSATTKLDFEQVRGDLIKIQTLPKPETPEEVEPFVLKRTTVGDILSEGGPSTYYFAALEYYRAVVAYHDQDEIVQIFSRTAPPEVYALLDQIIAISKSSSESSPVTEGWHLVEEGSETGSATDLSAPVMEPMD
ncbi:hypothetical protein BDY24DRAFT_391121 [Mrakia frigida]|uniref:uncharacterized protein n=1 Tax=Mrakia frigida TaxID=29902 RepID=UPI003FCBF266